MTFNSFRFTSLFRRVPKLADNQTTTRNTMRRYFARSFMTTRTRTTTTTLQRSSFSTTTTTTTFPANHNNQHHNHDHPCNVLILGGGPVGLSTAYHLAAQLRHGNGEGIVVVEQDYTYAQASSTLSAGGIRQQFSLLQNVQMSLYGLHFLRNAAELLSPTTTTTNHSTPPPENDDCIPNDTHKKPNPMLLEEHGYLFLASTERGKQQMIQNHATQQQAGATGIHLLSPCELQAEFPWLSTTSTSDGDIVLGSYGRSGEGWFDPWSLIQGLKRKCQSMGVQFVSGRPVGTTRERIPDGSSFSLLSSSSHSTTSSQLFGTQRIRQVHIQETISSNNNNKSNHDAIRSFSVDYVVNATGAHCRSVLDTIARDVNDNFRRWQQQQQQQQHHHQNNYIANHHDSPLQFPIPVYPRKRCIFSFHCPKAAVPVEEGGSWIAPLTVCPTTGVYFRSTRGSTISSGRTSTSSSSTTTSTATTMEDGHRSGHFIAGVSPPAEHDDNVLVANDWNHSASSSSSSAALFSTTPTAQDYTTLFEDIIWPALYERVPDFFDEIKVQNSWAGLYEYNVWDQNGIIDFHPELQNVLLVNGFSGHGLQHSPASGRAAAELLEYDGQFQSLDLSLFNFSRLLVGVVPPPPQQQQQQQQPGGNNQERTTDITTATSGVLHGVPPRQLPPLVFEQAIV